MKFKHIISALLPVLLLLAGAELGAAPWLRAQDFEKNYSKTFPISGSGNVRLDNRYGEIKVETWTRNEVQIDVRVKVTASSKENADRAFNRIEITFSGSGNSASAVTSIGEGSNKSWFRQVMDGDWGWNNNSNDFRIYYTVKMPASVNLETSAKYCDVSLPNLSGNTLLTVGYGDLVAGDLAGTNEISVSYGSARVALLGKESAFKIRYGEGVLTKVGDLRYDGRYSDCRIGTAKKLTVDIGYEELEIESAEELRMTGSYNDLEIGKVGRVFLDGNYCDFSIGRVTKEIEVDGSYGDLEIQDLAATFERVYIRTRYIDVALDVEAGAGYTMDLVARYGDISIDQSRAKVNSSKESNSHTIRGTMPGNGTGKIDISTSYGDIEIR